MENSHYVELLKQISEIRKENSGLKKRNQILENENKKLTHKISVLIKENKELKRRLSLYENPHTPPSLLKKKRPPIERNSSGVLGAKPGHEKYERQQPEPTETVKHEQATCPGCQHKLGNPFKIEEKIIEEIPDPQPIKVIRHLIYHYQCTNCGKIIIPKHNVPKGMFGWNLQTQIVLSKYVDRLTLRKIEEALERQYKIKITNTGILRITGRASNLLEKEFQNQISLIRLSKVVNVDETKIKVNGKPYWIWVFVGENQTIFVIRKSRAKKVLEEVLGKIFLGTIGCDGWDSYKQFSSNLQRCWAHILRESHETKEKHKEFDFFHGRLKEFFEKIKEVREKPPSLEERQKIKQKLEEELEQLVDSMDGHKKFKKIATKIRNGLPYWFTCVVNLLVEPTNNIAERALRELVVQRKIIGGLRREKGAKTMEITHSMVATWKQQEKPLFETLKTAISR